jgi:hypothetical protein
METYVSVVSWSGDPQPDSGDVRAAIRRQDALLRRLGLHSVAFFQDGNACSAVMVSTVREESDVEPLAAAILPLTSVHVESMRFDSDASRPVWSDDRTVPEKRRREYLDAVLEAVASGS